MRSCSTNNGDDFKNEQDNIPVGCVLPACQPYMFQWTQLDVSSCSG